MLAAGLLVAGNGSAAAQESTAPQEAPPSSGAPAAVEAPATSEAPDSFRWTRFELHGRVLVRGWTDHEEGESTSDFDAENARLELRWRPARWLRGGVEYDQAEDKHLKDAYLAFRGRFEIRADRILWAVPIDAPNPETKAT